MNLNLLIVTVYAVCWQPLQKVYFENKNKISQQTTENLVNVLYANVYEMFKIFSTKSL